MPQVALQRLSPGRDFDDNIVFKGWSKMATPLTSFRITQVNTAAMLKETAAQQLNKQMSSIGRYYRLKSDLNSTFFSTPCWLCVVHVSACSHAACIQLSSIRLRHINSLCRCVSAACW
jgi:hypothetical protein